MYYPGMAEHWGPHGWGGFPDWDSPVAVGTWLLDRPVEIGKYANREVRHALALLAVFGGAAVAKRSRALAVLLITPYVLAVGAALLGKYPLADRTTFFLLPCLWLLAACGVGAVVAWGRRRGRELTAAGLPLVAWGFTGLVVTLGRPDGHIDYRGAYQFVHAHRRPDDLLFSQMAVVYQTYYGTDAPVLKDHEFDDAVRRAGGERLWVVWGDNRPDLRQRVEASGGRVALRHHVSGLDVLLFEPRHDSAARPVTHGG
jgi:hypothetical protein